MKSTDNKSTSLLGSILFAFSIMLFMPSMASATHHGSHGSHATHHGSHGSHASHGSHHSSHCDKYSSYAEKYKKLAEVYLAKYNATHCYTYYKYYLCYAKKYEYYKNKYDNCQSNTSGTVDCSKYQNSANYYKQIAQKYKTYADKYLAAYNKCHFYCYYYYYKCFIKKYNYYMSLYNAGVDKYNECQAAYNLGSAFGTILVDGHGQEGIAIILTDSTGATHTATTDANGRYTFTSIPKGNATVDIVDSSLPAGSEITTGTDPQENITIAANSSLELPSIGYALPVPVGGAAGYVLVNGQGQQGVTVTLTDEEGNTYSTQTNAAGQYTFTDIPEGSVTIDVNDSTLPNGVELSEGSDPQEGVAISANNNTELSPVSYTSVVLTGDAFGYVLVNGEGAQNIQVLLIDAEGNTHAAQTDPTGKYTFTDIPEGSVTIDINDSTLPSGVVLSSGQDPLENVVINDGETNDVGSVEYDSVALVGEVSGYVILNGMGLSDVNLTLTDSENHTYLATATTSNTGHYLFSNIPVGTTTVTIDNTTLPANASLISNNDSQENIVVTSNASTGVETIAYETGAVVRGSVFGYVKVDTNDDGIFDVADDAGMGSVAVTVTDANGLSKNTTTNESGYWSISGLSLGEVSVQVSDSAILQNYSLAYGVSTKTLTLNNNGTLTDAGAVGYTQNAVTTGSVFGYVKIDTNKNGIFDILTDMGIAQITITVTDVNGVDHNTQTNVKGYWSIAELPMGEVTVKVSDSTILENHNITFGNHVSTVVLNSNGNLTDAGAVGYRHISSGGSGGGDGHW